MVSSASCSVCTPVILHQWYDAGDVNRRGGLAVVMLGALAALGSGPAAPPAGRAAVLTDRYDNARTGANPYETLLTTSNVSPARFGRLFSRAVDGEIYAQPLFVADQELTRYGRRNVVVVCTEHNSVYAFDADDPAAAAPLWHVNVGPSVRAESIDSSRDIRVEIGITSTPVIDAASNTLFVVAETLGPDGPVFRLHALGLADGTERAPGPVEIRGDVPGSSADAVGGRIAFRARMQWQRPGLLLSGGSVLVAFGSHQDAPPYHGWVFAYEANGLARTAVFCTSPGSTSAGIWQGGVGLSAAPNGDIFVVTGDGLLTAERGGHDYGDSVLRLSRDNLSVLDYFSPADQAQLRRSDRDLGSTGVLIVGADPSIAVTGSKDGRVFVLDQRNLGRFATDDRVVQEWRTGRSLFGGMVYAGGTLYMWPVGDRLQALPLEGSRFDTVHARRSSVVAPEGFANGPAMSVSSNHGAPGSAILWASYSANGPADGGVHSGILRAFDAGDISRELWNSNMNAARDSLGSWAKWSAPTVADGKVFVATFDHRLTVYGLL
jgi:hypothetical protein